MKDSFETVVQRFAQEKQYINTNPVRRNERWFAGSNLVDTLAAIRANYYSHRYNWR